MGEIPALLKSMRVLPLTSLQPGFQSRSKALPRAEWQAGELRLICPNDLREDELINIFQKSGLFHKLDAKQEKIFFNRFIRLLGSRGKYEPNLPRSVTTLQFQ